MNILQVLVLFLYFEVIALVFISFFILIKRWIFIISSKANAERKKKLSAVIANCFENKKECHLISKLYKAQLLLEILEEYNLRFSGEDWEFLRNGTALQLLLPKARKWAKRRSWIKRNLASRIFALCPLQEDEPSILKLIEDRYFLVSSVATLAAVRLESEKGIIKTLSKMDQQEGYSHYYYADVLSQGSTKVFNFIADIASKHNKHYFSCLEVLALKGGQTPLSFLSKDLKSKDLKTVKAALKVAIRYPKEEYCELFCHLMLHDDSEVKALAASGLSLFSDSTSCLALKKGAQDTTWDVKLASANSLKILDKLDLVVDSELKQYVKDFD